MRSKKAKRVRGYNLVGILAFPIVHRSVVQLKESVSFLTPKSVGCRISLYYAKYMRTLVENPDYVWRLLGQ